MGELGSYNLDPEVITDQIAQLEVDIEVIAKERVDIAEQFRVVQ